MDAIFDKCKTKQNKPDDERERGSGRIWIKRFKFPMVWPWPKYIWCDAIWFNIFRRPQKPHKLHVCPIIIFFFHLHLSQFTFRNMIMMMIGYQTSAYQKPKWYISFRGWILMLMLKHSSITWKIIYCAILCNVHLIRNLYARRVVAMHVEWMNADNLVVCGFVDSII